MSEHPLKNHKKYKEYSNAKIEKKYEEFIENLNENAKKEFEFYEVINGELQPNQILAEDMKDRTIDYVYEQPKKLMVVFDVDQVLWNSNTDRGIRRVPQLVLKVLGELNIGVGIISNSLSFLNIKDQVEKLYGYPIIDINVHLKNSDGDMTKIERMKKILDVNKNTKIMFLDDDVDNVTAIKNNYEKVDSQFVFGRYTTYHGYGNELKSNYTDLLQKINDQLNALGNERNHCTDVFSEVLKRIYSILYSKNSKNSKNLEELENNIIFRMESDDVCLSLIHFLCRDKRKLDTKSKNHIGKISRKLILVDFMYSHELMNIKLERLKRLLTDLMSLLNSYSARPDVDVAKEVNYIISLSETSGKFGVEQISAMNKHIHETYGKIMNEATEYIRDYFENYLKELGQ